MRSLFIAFAFAAFFAGAACAETRIFIVPADAENVAVNRCMSPGEKCGALAAEYYCRAQRYARATSFQKVDPKDITGGVPESASACEGDKCKQFVAIECKR